MATPEPAPASAGPRYAPDDPTLPKPWKGLIDGSTGLLYYWNPETNITQYEKPATVPPPLPPGPPPPTPTPKLAPIPVASANQPNGYGQQVMSASQQQGLQSNQLPQQHGQQMPHQHMNQHSGQHMSQYPGQQMPQHPSQQMLLQPGQQMLQHPGQQTVMQPGHQMTNQQTHQQIQFMAYQQSMYHHGHGSNQHTQNLAQGQQYPPQQEHKAGLSQREDANYQLGNQTGISPSSSAQNMLGSTSNTVQMAQMGVQSGQAQHFGGSSISMPQTGTDLAHQQQGYRYHGQMAPGPTMVRNQQPIVPSVGPRPGYEENNLGRAGHDYFAVANNDGSTMVSQQPKLAALPMGRNQPVS